MNWTLYKREMKKSLKLLILFGLVITMYVAIIIGMYEPEMMASLDQIVEMMPELMSAVGMKAGENTLIGFIISYLYGFILLVFPMVFCMIRANGLVSSYVEKGSMVTLLCAPIKKSKIVCTQMYVLMSGILLLIFYATGLEIGLTMKMFPNEIVVKEILMLNGGLLCLHIFIGSICFLASCLFSETKYSLAFGVGIPTFMYVVQMLGNVGEKAEFLKNYTFFTLFDTYGLVSGTMEAIVSALLLLVGAFVLYALSVLVFCRKDMHV